MTKTFFLVILTTFTANIERIRLCFYGLEKPDLSFKNSPTRLLAEQTSVINEDIAIKLVPKREDILGIHEVYVSPGINEKIF